MWRLENDAQSTAPGGAEIRATICETVEDCQGGSSSPSSGLRNLSQRIFRATRTWGVKPRLVPGYLGGIVAQLISDYETRLGHIEEEKARIEQRLVTLRSLSIWRQQ